MESDIESRRCRLCGIQNTHLRHLFDPEYTEVLHKFKSTISALVC